MGRPTTKHLMVGLALLLAAGAAVRAADSTPPAAPAATRPAADPVADAAAIDAAWTRARAMLVAGDDAGAAKLAQIAAGQHRTPSAARDRLGFLIALHDRAYFGGVTAKRGLPTFQAIARSRIDCPYRTAAGLIVAIESGQQPAENFAALAKLATDSDDELILWATGVEARAIRANEPGAKAYARLLEKTHGGGPAILFQTYANLLDDLDRFEDALVQRKRSVAIEPTGWNYDGLGNTLCSLSRYNEADAAHAEAIRLAPNEGRYAAHRARDAQQARRPKDAVVYATHATELDPKDPDAWFQLGRAQLDLKDSASAEVSLRKSLELDPKPGEWVTWALAEALDAEGLPDQAAAVRKQYGLDAK